MLFRIVLLKTLRLKFSYSSLFSIVLLSVPSPPTRYKLSRLLLPFHFDCFSLPLFLLLKWSLHPISILKRVLSIITLSLILVCLLLVSRSSLSFISSSYPSFYLFSSPYPSPPLCRIILHEGKTPIQDSYILYTHPWCISPFDR